jgi:hypothetical protein
MHEVENLIEALQNDLFQYANIEFEIKRVTRIANEQNETKELLKQRIANNELQILTILKKKYESNI